MNDRLSRAVAGWLAHPSGVFQALATTAVWFATPPLFHWSWSAAVFWYLGYCTFISFATQFTLAYQNRKAETALELALRNMTDLMRLVVALAEEIKHEQEELAAEVEDLFPEPQPLLPVDADPLAPQT